MASYNVSLFKAANKIIRKNRERERNAAQAQQRGAMIGQIGSSISDLIGAYSQRQQYEKQQAASAALGAQFGLDPSVSSQLSPQDLSKAYLQLKLTEQDRARQQQDAGIAAQLLGLKSETGYGNMGPSDLAEIARAKSSGGAAAQMWTVPEKYQSIYGSEIPAGAASAAIQGINQAVGREAFQTPDGGTAVLGVDAAGNKIVIPITEKTAGTVQRSITGREGFQNKQEIVDTQQAGALARTQEVTNRAMQVANLKADVSRRLADVNAQIQAGNRDARLAIARDALAQRYAQLEQSAYDKSMGREYGVIQSTVRNTLDPKALEKMRGQAEATIREIARKRAAGMTPNDSGYSADVLQSLLPKAPPAMIQRILSQPADVQQQMLEEATAAGWGG